MKKLVLSTRNQHKIKEVEAILNTCLSSPVTLLSLDDIGLYGEIEEDAKKNIKYSFLNEKNEVQNHSNNLIFRIVVARQYKFCCWVLA